jgi:hypothetical protein
MALHVRPIRLSTCIGIAVALLAIDVLPRAVALPEAHTVATALDSGDALLDAVVETLALDRGVILLDAVVVAVVDELVLDRGVALLNAVDVSNELDRGVALVEAEDVIEDEVRLDGVFDAVMDARALDRGDALVDAEDVMENVVRLDEVTEKLSRAEELIVDDEEAEELADAVDDGEKCADAVALCDADAETDADVECVFDTETDSVVMLVCEVRDEADRVRVTAGDAVEVMMELDVRVDAVVCETVTDAVDDDDCDGLGDIDILNNDDLDKDASSDEEVEGDELSDVLNEELEEGGGEGVTEVDVKAEKSPVAELSTEGDTFDDTEAEAGALGVDTKRSVDVMLKDDIV